jgi:acetylornithine deacetylase/succinyl-diaminopimelate desuccinylase-like protein
MPRPDLPAIVYGLRGLSYIQVEVTGPAGDLHSGSFGGAIYNPIQALVEMIASLKDRDGRVTVPGFYDRVRPLDADERRALAEASFDGEKFKLEAGVAETWGEKGYSALEQITARPTLEVNGIWGGTGCGQQDGAASKAYAKISAAWWPIKTIARSAACWASISSASRRRRCTETKALHGGQGILTTDCSADEVAVRAGGGFGSRPVFIREGARSRSSPRQAIARHRHGADGPGLSDDNLHAPNEKFYLPNFYRGIEASIHFMTLLGQ